MTEDEYVVEYDDAEADVDSEVEDELEEEEFEEDEAEDGRIDWWGGRATISKWF